MYAMWMGLGALFLILGTTQRNPFFTLSAVLFFFAAIFASFDN